jgi:hypothetical protein
MKVRTKRSARVVRIDAVRECRVCMGRHEREIHAATISVRARFRAEVTRDLERPRTASCSRYF